MKLKEEQDLNFSDRGTLMSTGRKFFDTRHAFDRFVDRNRFPTLNGEIEFKKKLLWVATNASKEILTKYKDGSHEYGIHSKSTGIGMIIDWRQDYKNRNDIHNHMILVTILPIRNFHSFKDSDIPLMVETLMTAWAKENGKKIHVTEGAVNHFTEDILDVIFFEGKYHDCNVELENFIFVD